MSFINSSGLMSSAIADATFPCNQNAGTYQIGQVYNGRVLISSWGARVAQTVTGLTSVQLQTSSGIALTPAIPVASLIAGAQASQSLGHPILLEAGESIQAVVVGNGTGGSIDMDFVYTPAGDTSVIA